VIDVELFGYRLSLDGAFLGRSASEPEIRRQFREYECGRRRGFDLPVRFPDGFTGRVWRAVSDIGYGETRTYGVVAADLGTAPVAVGGANARNPLPVVVPCHRLVGVDSFRGYRYPGLKAVLLCHESGEGAHHPGAEANRSA
jgi:methylated-DNA-[protein]-cysteine S-methyltransferase